MFDDFLVKIRSKIVLVAIIIVLLLIGVVAIIKTAEQIGNLSRDLQEQGVK